MARHTVLLPHHLRSENIYLLSLPIHSGRPARVERIHHGTGKRLIGCCTWYRMIISHRSFDIEGLVISRTRHWANDDPTHMDFCWWLGSWAVKIRSQLLSLHVMIVSSLAVAFVQCTARPSLVRTGHFAGTATATQQWQPGKWKVKKHAREKGKDKGDTSSQDSSKLQVKSIQ